MAQNYLSIHLLIVVTSSVITQSGDPKVKRMRAKDFFIIKNFILPVEDSSFISNPASCSLRLTNEALLKLTYFKDKKWGSEEVLIDLINNDKVEIRLYVIQRRWTHSQQTKEGEIKTSRSKAIYWVMNLNNEHINKQTELKSILNRISESNINKGLQRN